MCHVFVEASKKDAFIHGNHVGILKMACPPIFVSNHVYSAVFLVCLPSRAAFRVVLVCSDSLLGTKHSLYFTVLCYLLPWQGHGAVSRFSLFSG